LPPAKYLEEKPFLPIDPSAMPQELAS